MRWYIFEYIYIFLFPALEIFVSLDIWLSLRSDLKISLLSDWTENFQTLYTDGYLGHI